MKLIIIDENWVLHVYTFRRMKIERWEVHKNTQAQIRSQI